MGAVPVIDLRGDRDAVARRIDIARYQPVLAGRHLMQKFQSTHPAGDDGR